MTARDQSDAQAALNELRATRDAERTVAAAAPDLLSALKRLQRVFFDVVHATQSTMSPRQRKVFEASKAAIAKAEGK